MRATCKLCGVVIETDPDPVMDEGRSDRERIMFFNRVAAHIDPKNRYCQVNNFRFATNRFAMAMQDNGWFQRWRLLACLDNLDEKLAEKAEEWREYLHTITAPKPPGVVAEVESEFKVTQ